MKFQIVSDSSCDLPKERAQELGVDIVPFYVSFEEENYMKEGVDISVEDFYQMMADRAGTFPKTSMPSVQDYVDVFEKYVKDGVPVLCICLNAAFSGSIQSAMNAKNQILEDYPEAQIEVVDSEEVTALQGMFVEEACRLRGAGSEGGSEAAGRDPSDRQNLFYNERSGLSAAWRQNWQSGGDNRQCIKDQADDRICQ